MYRNIFRPDGSRRLPSANELYLKWVGYCQQCFTYWAARSGGNVDAKPAVLPNGFVDFGDLFTPHRGGRSVASDISSHFSTLRRSVIFVSRENKSFFATCKGAT